MIFEEPQVKASLMFTLQLVRNCAVLLVLCLAYSSHSLADVRRIDQNTIYLEGEIQLGDFDKFLAEAIKSKPPLTLVLNSPGGDVLEANRIASFVREAWISTEVSGTLFPDLPSTAVISLEKPVVCDSACTLIFIAGAVRLYQVDDEENGRPALGFHRAYLSPDANAQLSPLWSSKLFAIATNYYTDALKEYGAATSFIELVLATGSNEIVYLGASDFYATFGEVRVLGDGIPWLEEFVSSKCGPHLTEEEYEAYEANYENEVGKALRDRIYSQLECRNELRNSHQKNLLRKLREQ